MSFNSLANNKKQMNMNKNNSRKMRQTAKWLSVAAVAAIVAACSNDVILRDDIQTPTDAPKAIGFSSYSEKITRGDLTDPLNLEYYHTTFAVFGTKVSKYDATDIQYVFGGQPTINTTDATAAVLNPEGTTCTYQAAALNPILGDWRYQDPRYWDKNATYNFIGYAPVVDNNPIAYYYDNVEGILVGAANNQFKTTALYTLVGTNLQNTPTEAEINNGFNVNPGAIDIMISAPVAEDGNTHYAGNNADVNLVFRHILSKLNLKITKGEALHEKEVKLTELKIEGFKNEGNYVEKNYNTTANPKVSGWALADASDTVLIGNATANSAGYVLRDGSYSGTTYTPITEYFIESLVMPQTIADNQVTLTLKYTIKVSDNYSENYTYKLDLYDVEDFRQFYDAYRYTLNITINPEVITFDADASAWTEKSYNIAL